MATLTKTYTFASTNEGFTFSGSAWNSTDQSLEAVSTGRNTQVDSVATKTDTFLNIGIPSGSTITNLQLIIDHRLKSVNVGSYAYFVVQLDGVINITQYDYTMSPTSWLTRNGATVGVNKVPTDSFTILVDGFQRNGNNTSASMVQQWDNLQLVVTYTPPSENKSGTVAISNGDQMSVTGVALIVYEKTGTVSVSDGPTQTMTGQKLARAPPLADSMGDQISMTGLSNSPDGITTRGLLVDWRGEDFSNDPPTTELADRSGNGNVGLSTGYAYNDTNSGRTSDGAIILTGETDGYLSITKTGSYLPTLRAIEGVFKTRVPVNGWSSVVTAYWYLGPPFTDPTNGGFAFFVHDNGNLGIHYLTTDPDTRHYDLFSDVNFLPDVKYHGLLQYDTTTSNLDFYLNGTLVKRLNLPTMLLPKRRFAFGNWTSEDGGTSYAFNGSIYEARAYDTILTQEEITQNYEISMGIVSNDKTGTVAVTNGDTVALSGKKEQDTDVSLSSGDTVAIQGLKSPRTDVVLSSGDNTPITGQKSSTVTTGVTIGIQMDVTGSPVLELDIVLTHGDRMTITGTKTMESVTALSHGETVAIAVTKATESVLEATVGPQVQIAVTPTRNVTPAVLVSHGAIQTMEVNGTRETDIAIQHGDRIETESAKSVGSTIAVTNGGRVFITQSNEETAFEDIQMTHGINMAVGVARHTATDTGIQSGDQTVLTTNKTGMSDGMVTGGGTTDGEGLKQSVSELVHHLGVDVSWGGVRGVHQDVSTGTGMDLYLGGNKHSTGQAISTSGIIVYVIGDVRQFYLVNNRRNIIAQEDGPQSIITYEDGTTVISHINDDNTVRITVTDAPD